MDHVSKGEDPVVEPAPTGPRQDPVILFSPTPVRCMCKPPNIQDKQDLQMQVSYSHPSGVLFLSNSLFSKDLTSSFIADVQEAPVFFQLLHMYFSAG